MPPPFSPKNPSFPLKSASLHPLPQNRLLYHKAREGAGNMVKSLPPQSEVVLPLLNRGLGMLLSLGSSLNRRRHGIKDDGWRKSNAGAGVESITDTSIARIAGETAVCECPIAIRSPSQLKHHVISECW